MKQHIILINYRTVNSKTMQSSQHLAYLPDALKMDALERHRRVPLASISFRLPLSIVGLPMMHPVLVNASGLNALHFFDDRMLTEPHCKISKLTRSGDAIGTKTCCLEKRVPARADLKQVESETDLCQFQSVIQTRIGSDIDLYHRYPLVH